MASPALGQVPTMKRDLDGYPYYEGGEPPYTGGPVSPDYRAPPPVVPPVALPSPTYAQSPPSYTPPPYYPPPTGYPPAYGYGAPRPYYGGPYYGTGPAIIGSVIGELIGRAVAGHHGGYRR